MQSKGETRNHQSFTTNRKKEDEAQNNRENAMKAKLAHLKAVREAQKSGGKAPSK